MQQYRIIQIGMILTIFYFLIYIICKFIITKEYEMRGDT